MSRRLYRSLSVLLVLAALLAGCAQPAPVATVAPAQPTAVPPIAVPPTSVPPTEVPAPTAVRPTAVPAAEKLILATTTSTADSGLLDFILPDFESKFNAKVDVIAVGSGQAIEIGSKGDADVLLVHSRKAEDKFVADGFARERYDVMYNDFVLVGPKDDPAKVAGMGTGKQAFKAIADAETLFVSRGDKSGTNTKELAVWASIPITPTAEMKWYNAIGQGMGDTLLFANESGGYTVADRGTWLAMQAKLPNLTIVVGGDNLAENKDKALLNPYGVLAVNPDKHPKVKYDLAMHFAEWLLSKETQALIGGFGVDEYGQPLFYPDSEEYKSTNEVTVTIGDESGTFTLADLQALPKVALVGYEAIGHKKGPLGANDWAGPALKDLLLKVDPTISDAANDGRLIVVTASDGWKSTLRWNQVFGTPAGGEALADAYGCTECHGMMGEGTAPKGKNPTPALAGKGWKASALTAMMRASHGGINPYTPEQLPDADIEAIALWFADPSAPAPAGAYTVPAEQMITILAYERNGKAMTGHDGLLQLLMGMDKYTSRYAHWVKTIEVLAK